MEKTKHDGIRKKDITVNHPLRYKENNIFGGDYACYDKNTGRKLPRKLCYYFSSWGDYLNHGG